MIESAISDNNLACSVRDTCDEEGLEEGEFDAQATLQDVCRECCVYVHVHVCSSPLLHGLGNNQVLDSNASFECLKKQYHIPIHVHSVHSVVTTKKLDDGVIRPY